MKPALSIILFTVSSGAGLGLLALLALTDLIAPDAVPARALVPGAVLALSLFASGLASSLLHLAKPANAWRALSRFRTSWLSREAVFAAILFPVALGYVVLIAGDARGIGRGLLAGASCLLSWAVLISTAMIYASLKPIRAWHSAWTPVNYALLGHWSGAVCLFGLARAYGGGSETLARVAAGLGAAALLAKLCHWRTIRDDARALTIERAIGVRDGVRPPGVTVAQARPFDAGHSHGTFLTHEFGFELARHHATLLRALALGLGFGLPAMWVFAGITDARIALAAAVFCIIGLLAERWLFFAEARHTVRLYHGDPRA